MASSNSSEAKRAPLAGIRIVEFAGIGPGPFAGMLLADLGAEVIRIERPGAEPGGAVERSRIRVELDLKREAATALDLIAGADALIEGFRPGVMERLGLGPETALARNRGLVYGRMTGWGQTGPLAMAAGHDLNYIALTGALGSMGDPGNPPAPPLNLVGDYGGGALYLAVGLLAGILSVRAGGEGQVVDCAIVDGTASMMSIFFDLMAVGKWHDRRGVNFIDGASPSYRTYRCSDGRYVSVAPLEPQFFERLRQLLGLDDALFERREEPEAWPEIAARLETVFASRTQSQWCDLLEGSDACFAPVLGLEDATRHPHMAAREIFVDFEGRKTPNAAPRFSSWRPELRSSTTVAARDLLDRWSRC